MLLESPRRLAPQARAFVLAGFMPALLLVAGCAVSYDESQLVRSKSARSVDAAESPAQPAGRLEQEERPGSFLGIRLDPAPDRKREARIQRMTDDPRLHPSPREQREARAMAMAQAEIMRQDGGILYRGDGSASSPEQVRFIASRGALTVDYRAADLLNRADGLPHALVFVVYHLSNRAAFDQLASHEEGLRRLLEGERFDNSALSVEQHVIQPGMAGSLQIHRPENGRYVGLVAGYARGDARTAVHVAEYGMGRYKKEGKSYLDRMVYMFTPLPMHLKVDLDETDMWVRDTGLIYGDMRNVTNLMWRQTQYYQSEMIP